MQLKYSQFQFEKRIIKLSINNYQTISQFPLHSDARNIFFSFWKENSVYVHEQFLFSALSFSHFISIYLLKTVAFKWSAPFITYLLIMELKLNRRKSQETINYC